MQFVNHTELVARLFSGALTEKLNGAWVVARRTFRLPSPGGDLQPAPLDEQWPIFASPLETEMGVFPSDDFPFRGRAELIVVATARSRRPVTYLAPRVRLGGFSDRLMVFGDRRWVKKRGELVPGVPLSFTEMELGPKNAFGGQGEYGGESVAHPLNPAGKGFHLTAEAADGAPLPNLERHDALIQHWNDQPVGATWGLVPNGQLWQLAAWNEARSKSGAPPPTTKEELARFQQEAAKQVRSSFPTAAPPRLLLDAIQAGDDVDVDLGEERLHFRVPGPTPTMRVAVGARTFEPTVRPIAVWIFVPKQLVVVTWMARYRYGLRRGERRESTFLTAPT